MFDTFVIILTFLAENLAMQKERTFFIPSNIHITALGTNCPPKARKLLDATQGKQIFTQPGGPVDMELMKRLVKEESGQGLTEYALILGLVVLGFWIAIKNTNLGPSLSNIFTKVKGNVDNCC